MFARASALRGAYLATSYVVFVRGRAVAIRVGARSPAVEAMIGRGGAAFVTAWNPFSRRRGSAINGAAQRRLVARLHSAGYRFLPGEGRGAAGDWPAERSVLVLAISLRAAARLGRVLRQNAIVFVRRGRAAELVPLA